MNQRQVHCVLESLIEKLCITDLQTELPPISNEERVVVKIQLIAARIILNDAEIEKRNNPEKSREEIFEELTQNWKISIKNFVKALHENGKFM